MVVMVQGQHYSNIKNVEGISVFYNFMILLMKDSLGSKYAIMCIISLSLREIPGSLGSWPQHASVLPALRAGQLEKELSWKFCSIENSGFSTESKNIFLSHGTA